VIRRPEPASGAIIGRRPEQQDAVRIEQADTGLLLIVADGMGGHAGGQVASQLSVDAFAAAYRMGAALSPAERLRAALDVANHSVGAKTREEPELLGMGCTLVAALVFGDRVRWISVGDSLLLAIKNGQLIRLNADHSLAPEIDRAVLEGRISEDEARNDPDRHVLRSAVSGGPIALIDEGQQRLGAGAFVLLATDGLLTLPESRIAELGSGSLNARHKVAALLDEVTANMPEDQDNMTLAAVHCGGALAGETPRRGGRRRALGLLLLVLALAGTAAAAWLLFWPESGPRVDSDRPAPTSTSPAGGADVTGPRIEATPPAVPAPPGRKPGKETDETASPPAARPAEQPPGERPAQPTSSAPVPPGRQAPPETGTGRTSPTARAPDPDKPNPESPERPPPPSREPTQRAADAQPKPQ
jgi:serine/threonine protein phosphatase PrpC